ncbi:MAG: helix-hairpin-helix domain-containing protein [Eggerthellaceae bacterium]|nr:helix-hairpin-helix domain-containing protein [Eggerthellaceae bacterium]
MDRGIISEIRSKLGAGGSSRTVLIGMAALLAMVAVAVGFVLSGAATSSNFELENSYEAEPAKQALESERTLFVHVSGAVNSPGLYEVGQGSRVADAVQAAGGFAEDADADSCNLARVLDDGEHIVIARYAEETPESPSTSGEGSSNAASLININTASEAQLETLPGIGASTAAKIVKDRESNGPFKSVQDLTRVSGIGDKKLEALVDLVCV